MIKACSHQRNKKKPNETVSFVFRFHRFADTFSYFVVFRPSSNNIRRCSLATDAKRKEKTKPQAALHFLSLRK